MRANSAHSSTPPFSTLTSSALGQRVRTYPSELGAILRLAVPAAQPAFGMTHSAFRGRIVAHQVQASGTMSCEEEDVTSIHRQGDARWTMRLLRKRCSVHSIMTRIVVRGGESRDTSYLRTPDGGVHELNRKGKSVEAT